MNRIIRVKKYMILPLLLLVTLGMNRTFAQDKITVHGTVKDEQQNALVGVTIVATATKTGVATDINGNFELTCPAGAELKISYVGYKNQTLKADAKMSITLLSDEVGIDEVTIVAVGYGTMRKKDLTGSIATVSADQFKKGVVNSSEQLLQGKVAGLTVIQGDGNPAMGSSIRLRGGTSLSASNGPLVVVDGVPGVDFNTVQPTEIVSIDVLKDASAAAIYGSRGANGVIIVTTNRETKGKTMEYSGYAGFGTVAKNLDLLSANQWRQNVRDNNIKSAVDYGGDTDWQKEIEQNSFSQSHSLSFSSANENSGYRASFNYLDSEGIIKKSYLNRMGMSISAFQYGLNDHLKLEFSLHANTDKWSNPDYTIFDRAYNLNPTIPVMQNGKYTQVGGTNNNNPVELLENRTDDNSRKRILGYGKAEYKILEGLKAVANVSYEFNGAEGGYYLPSYAFNEITDKGYGRRTVADYTTMQLETYLNYERKIMDFGKLNAMAGYSYLDNVYSGFGAERRGFDTDEFSYNNLAAGQDYRSGDVYSYKGKANLISFYGRVNATVKDRYMLTATLRRDGSSRFGENNKWGLFPSVSVGWRVSDESFMENAKDWLNNLKIRAGYGVTGNQDGIGEYKSLFLLGAGGASYFDATSGKWKQSYGAIQNPNPDLKWESTAQLNIGVDFSLWNRLNGTLEVYSKKTSDLLYTYDVPQPPYLYGTMMANVGDLSNKGIELSLNGSIMKRKDFRWDANLTMAHNVQKVDKLSNQIYQTDVVNSGSLHGLTGMSTVFSQILKEGYAVGTFWGPKCLGVDADGKFILANDGAPEVIGNAQPKLTAGFSTDLSYKDFELNISTYGMFGQSVLNATAMNISYPGRLPGYNVMDSFLKSGIKSDPVYSSYWIEDASFLRIQSVSLGYNVPLKKMAVKKLNVYITGENLFVFTNYKGIDPEVSIDGLSRPGIDILSYYPKPRTILLGVKMSF